MYLVNRQAQAYTYAAIVVLLWSTVASAFKISLQYLEPIQLLFYAATISLLTLFIILLAQKKLNLLRKCHTGDYFRSALLGLLNPFLYYAVLLRAYSILPAQQAVALNYTWAIQLVILSIPLLKQRIGFKSIIAIITGYFGVLIIATRGDFFSFRIVNIKGTLLALGSATIWALFWIYNVRDKRDEVLKLFLNFLFGFIFVSSYLILSGQFVIPDWAGFAGAFYVGIFEMGITFVFWLKALRLAKTTAQVSNLIYLTPFLALLIINLVVGEKILVSTIVGLSFIVAGIALQQYPLRRMVPNRQ
jgi:drug/metabolite transporter (DMT)-like permease